LPDATVEYFKKCNIDVVITEDVNDN
jgi:hypothetical protein